MAVNSVTDLVIGNEYYLMNVGDDARFAIKVILKDIDYPSKVHPELSQIEVSHPKYVMMVFDTWRIGIGETRKEAVKNFGRFK